MRLRAFAFPTQRRNWGQYGQILTEVVTSASSTSSNHHKAIELPTKHSCSSWIGHLELPTCENPTSSALQSLQDLDLPWLNPTTAEEQHDWEPAPKLILLQPPRTAFPSTKAALAYLRQVLPASAHCLQRYTTIGGAYGRTNGHGKPLDTHVAGVCHYFANTSLAELATLLDVYLPLRLALGASNFTDACPTANNTQEEDDDDDHHWEAVMENTDLILCDSSSSKSAAVAERWTQIWELQRADKCRETYAVCSTEQDALELRNHFDKHAASEK